MNFRALMLGALLGLAIAMGGACSRKACDGCMDGSGRCLPFAEQGVQACGRDGASCAACGPGIPCEAGVCRPGISAACLSTCPTGCCSADGSCEPGTRRAACGSAGAVCAACAEGDQCIDQGGQRACARPTVGTACTQDVECVALLGTGGQCKSVTAPGNAGYSAGYCTRPCGAQQPSCPGGSTCVDGLGSFGEVQALCLGLCEEGDGSAGGCREGYACYGLGASTGGLSACWLSPLPDPRAPTGFAGKACGSDADCGQPPYGARCVKQTLPDGGAAFPGGLCTSGCSGTLVQRYPDLCGPDGVCVTGFLTGPQGQPLSNCLRGCRVGMVGTGAQCREGYACQPFREDGGVTADGHCAPSCEVEGCTDGRSCSTLGPHSGLCLLPDGGL